VSVEPVRIGDRLIGPGQPPYVVAEVSANHLGELERALAILGAAAQAGADAVKLQTYTAADMTLDLAEGAFSIEAGPWQGQTLYQLYDAAHTPWEWHEELFRRGRELGIHVFSSPFSADAVARLETLAPPAYKIASFELVDHELVARCAATGRPLVMSTGMAGREEVREAVAAARAAGCQELVLLHCVSGYPTPVAESNLLRLRALAEHFSVPVGLSDHSLSSAVPTAAVALGACFIEKHLTLARAEGGPDAEFSLEPAELAALVRDVQDAYQALGHGRMEPAPSEAANAVFRRSIYVVRDLRAGEPLSRDNLRVIRPGLGLAPRELPAVLGRRASRALKRGEPLSWDAIRKERP